MHIMSQYIIASHSGILQTGYFGTTPVITGHVESNQKININFSLSFESSSKNDKLLKFVECKQIIQIDHAHTLLID